MFMLQGPGMFHAPFQCFHEQKPNMYVLYVCICMYVYVCMYICNMYIYIYYVWNIMMHPYTLSNSPVISYKLYE